ncbi:uncharacterized protein N7515_005634 [Penicillium bovifimosum]|uniref:AAA+ ATPase domain-containing protein n=1 Tax=Penicillium bovifimosum TaxID=126998 RepID=A0A9W9GT58_9EURO|nr:uncharacterized protein N7515_005634 [Penicillium bovifimosum]KAJ5129595.1 hypothetical protein N7515_005634 [Penicillium bovifimosum]
MASHQLQKGTQEIEKHMSLAQGDMHSFLASGRGNRRLEEEVITAPLFSLHACKVLDSEQQRNNQPTEKRQVYPQYGLLGLRTRPAGDTPDQEDLIYTNVSAPWSAFICGSQGSGKSHTLSCLLENALIKPSPAGKLSSPLAGLVVHYDKFTAFASTQLCEAAHLCSSNIPVRVLVSPTNYLAMKKAYTKLAGGSSMLKVQPLYLPQKDLNISMMKTLMAVNNKAGQPLYIEVIMKILRDMAIQNQGQAGFNYAAFKNMLDKEQFVRGQLMPLTLRLEVLESFFEPGSVPGATSKKSKEHDTDSTWKFSPGTLTIIDLSCPFVGPDDACALFNISLSLFLKDRQDTGRMIALDEAHKYMTSTAPEAVEFTETLLSVVRQQRHLGARVMIATQEPTLAPSLLELCNVTIIHRFSSPAWFRAIRSHIAGAGVEEAATKDSSTSDIFHRIVHLATGEALVFCPTALLDVQEGDEDAASNLSAGTTSSSGPDSAEFCDPLVDKEALGNYSGEEGLTRTTGPRPVQLGTSYAHIRVRRRITVDGGRSVLEV